LDIEYKKEDKIATITLNRPEARNSMNPEMMQELSRILVDFRDDSDTWVAIITGTGDKAFCGGADIKKMLPWLKENRTQPWNAPPTIWRGLELWKPVIAAINGTALGGGLELAIACDLRIASENAIFGTPEVTLGLIPGWGGTQRLPRIVPLAKAAEILLIGRPIDAQEAYRIGLVNKVVPLPELIPAAKEWAEAICKAGPLAVRAAKEAMLKGISLTLEEGLWLEGMIEDSLLITEDFEEGRQAFIEKRKPTFKAK